MLWHILWVYRQTGQGLLEYALVIAFVIAVGVALVSARPQLLEALLESFNSSADVVSSANSM
ncbi:MAG: hypothetical protein IKN33_03380 [Selenomonadaceae bacterium]|nr:hypothetical protein [Selenomonadaceae bacterium]